MPTEIFTKEQFEKALPHDKHSGNPAYHPYDGTSEYTYQIPIWGDDDMPLPVSILVMSSIRRGRDHCDGTGGNSIRAWLVGPDNKPLVSKDSIDQQRWVARTKNWRINMLALLRDLYKIGLALGRCPQCGSGPMRLLVTKNEHSSNFNRQYLKCTCGQFTWLDEAIPELREVK